MTMTRRRLLDDSFKKTVEGNPAIAIDSLARMYPDITMQGWTEQAKTTGAQLFDASKIPTKTQSGATVTNNGDGSFTISGSGNLSGRYSQQVALDNQDLETFKKSLKQGNITLKCESVTVPYFQININTSDGEEIIFPNYSAAQITNHLDQDQIDKIIGVILIFYVEKESPITNTTIKPMFYQSGDGTWEPYTGGQPSPSPDYPQEIVSAGNWNEETQKWEYEINIAGKNLFNKELFIEKALETGKFERVMKDGRDCLYINNSSWSDRTLNLMLFNPGVDMTLSYDAYLNAELIGVSSQGFCSQHKNGSFRYYLLGSSDALYKWNSQKYAVNGDIISLFVTYGTDSSVYFDLDSIQLEIGNAKTAYEEPKPLQTLTLTADRPLTKWDKLEKRNGQWGWVYKSAEIESYTDESVPGEYFSTTGQLSTGAQVWYETTTETFVPLTDTEQEAMNALHTYRPTTVLSNQQGCQMALTYKTRKNLGGGYNLLNYEDLTNIEKWIGQKGNSYCHFDIELKRNKKYRLSVVENNMNADYYAEHSGLPAMTFFVGENENTFTGNTCFGSSSRGQSSVLTEYEFQTTENPYYFNLYLPSTNWNVSGLHIVFDQLLIGIKLEEVN